MKNNLQKKSPPTLRETISFDRVLLKISGEVLSGKNDFGIDPVKALDIAKIIKSVYDLGSQIGIVIGGGNIFRGISVSAKGMDRVAADYLGMMATIDTAAVLRGIEIDANVIIKGTKVDGVYSSDPFKNDNAVKYDSLSFKEAIDNELKVMDLTAFTLCKENNLPVVVTNINNKNNLKNLIKFNNVGTIIS